MELRFLGLLVGAALVAAIFSSGCGDSKPPALDGPKKTACMGAIGDEGCRCQSNATCNDAALACIQGACQRSTGVAGASGAGAGGSAGSGAAGAGACATGTVGDSGCACYPNSTCNGALACVASVCVPAGAGGGAGDGAGGASGSGAGGAGGSGVSGSDGVSGSGAGGAGASGAGGVSGSGAGGASGGGAGGVSGSASGSAGASGGSAGASGGANLILNGDFSQGSAHWDPQIGASPTTSFTTNSGQFCLDVPALMTGTIGWPGPGEPGLNLSGTYTLSFQVSSTGSVMFTDKVGLSMSPYTAAFEHTQSVSSTLTTINDVNSISGNPEGLVFIASAGSSPITVCVDNVSLTLN